MVGVSMGTVKYSGLLFVISWPIKVRIVCLIKIPHIKQK